MHKVLRDVQFKVVGPICDTITKSSAFSHISGVNAILHISEVDHMQVQWVYCLGTVGVKALSLLSR